MPEDHFFETNEIQSEVLTVNKRRKDRKSDTMRSVWRRIKGLPVSTEIREMQEDLTTQGFRGEKLAQLTRAKTKSPLPIFQVERSGAPLEICQHQRNSSAASHHGVSKLESDHRDVAGGSGIRQ
ncbi:hypothetical protein TNCV_1449001 [Trichonephila clavipes]|nr:hypothetical protein TNCV_1449001 [Trichonephila clavipes]